MESFPQQETAAGEKSRRQWMARLSVAIALGGINPTQGFAQEVTTPGENPVAAEQQEARVKSPEEARGVLLGAEQQIMDLEREYQQVRLGDLLSSYEQSYPGGSEAFWQYVHDNNGAYPEDLKAQIDPLRQELLEKKAELAAQQQLTLSPEERASGIDKVVGNMIQGMQAELEAGHEGGAYPDGTWEEYTSVQGGFWKYIERASNYFSYDTFQDEVRPALLQKLQDEKGVAEPTPPEGWSW